MTNLDDPQPLHPGHPFDLAALRLFLQKNAPGIGEIQKVLQFPGGYSNLTYCLQTAERDYVLRRPPQGANIRSGHDMAREFRVLSLLRGHYAQVPEPILYCEDASILGAPFFLMERIPGHILRPSNVANLTHTPESMTQLSTALVDNLVSLHALNLETTGLLQLGRPEGYVERQVEGWTKRYRAAETDAIPAMNALIVWIADHLPVSSEPTLLHNDYKFDNVVFANMQVSGVLDWEMATVGDPLMDVGTMLAYWLQADDGPSAFYYNVTHLQGMLSRQQVADHYARQSGRYLSGIMFYYVFGLFKNAVIAQQIYARWKQGHSQDPRFGKLLPLILELAEKAERAIVTGRL